MTVIPALSLFQPWASFVALRIKPFETRGRTAPARLIGKRIAIQAAKQKPNIDDICDEMHAAMVRATGQQNWFQRLPLGAIVCTAALAESVPAETVTPDAFGNYTRGRFAWRFDDVRPVDPPIPASGRQMWGWPWEAPEGFVL